jgi:hypothetical protein
MAQPLAEAKALLSRRHRRYWEDRFRALGATRPVPRDDDDDGDEAVMRALSIDARGGAGNRHPQPDGASDLCADRRAHGDMPMDCGQAEAARYSSCRTAPSVSRAMVARYSRGGTRPSRQSCVPAPDACFGTFAGPQALECFSALYRETLTGTTTPSVSVDSSLVALLWRAILNPTSPTARARRRSGREFH